MTIKEYSSSFSRLTFQTPLPDSLAAIARRLDGESPPRLHNVHPISSGAKPRYAVKYFIARTQHLFGIFSDVVTATRLADMILVKFAYLRRGKRKTVTEESLNFTVEQARRDIENEHDINSLLIQFLADLDETLLVPKPITRTRRTARSELHAIREEIIERLNNRLDDLGKKIDVLADKLSRPAYLPGTLQPVHVPYYIGDPIPAGVIGDLPSTPIFGANTCCANSPGDANVSE